jgi:hypothetical protein
MRAASTASLEKIKALRSKFLSSIDSDDHVSVTVLSSASDGRTSDPTLRSPSKENARTFVDAMDNLQYKSSLKKSVRFDPEFSASDTEDSENLSIYDQREDDADDASSVSSNTTTSSAALSVNSTEASSSAKIFVRVLWDLENIAVPRRIGGLNVVSKIRDFLAKKGLLGTGIDTRITGFFSPEHKTMSSKTVEELDKAGVELVWVSSKREDADRKIGYRISQETQVLKDHKNTTFVIISSDQDFRHHMLLLLNEGYRVIVIHNAPPGKWSQSLEMQASEAYRWQEDVFGGNLPIGSKRKKAAAAAAAVRASPCASANASMTPNIAAASDSALIRPSESNISEEIDRLIEALESTPGSQPMLPAVSLINQSSDMQTDSPDIAAASSTDTSASSSTTVKVVAAEYKDIPPMQPSMKSTDSSPREGSAADTQADPIGVVEPTSIAMTTKTFQAENIPPNAEHVSSNPSYAMIAENFDSNVSSYAKADSLEAPTRSKSPNTALRGARKDLQINRKKSPQRTESTSAASYAPKPLVKQQALHQLNAAESVDLSNMTFEVSVRDRCYFMIA